MGNPDGRFDATRGRAFWQVAMFLIAAASAIATTAAADGPASGALTDVDKALKSAGISRGIAIECGSPDASVAIELARVSQMRVYRVVDDPAAAARDRAAVQAAGLSALRVRVEAGPLETVEFPRFAANVIVCTGLPDAKRLAEFGRIIRPEGLLFVLPAAKGQLGVDDVKRDMAKFGAAGWLEPLACGAGVCIQRAKPNGAADWSHYFRDPDNNRYSPDKLIRPPLRPLWYGEPVFPLGDLFLTQGLAAGGRLLLTDASPADTTRARLTCLDAYNGVLLWDRQAGGARYTKVEGTKADATIRAFQLPGRVLPGEMAATADRIYLADSQDCLVIDAATGADVARFKAPPPTHADNCWRFVACQGDTLFGVAGPPAVMPGTKPTTQPATGGPGGQPTIFALDIATGKERWVRGGSMADELGDSFGTPLAIGDGRIFLRVKAGLVALDTRTGKTAWKVDGLEDADKETWWEGVVSQGRFMLYKFNMRTWGDKKKLATIVVAAADGKLIGEPTRASDKDVFFDAKEGFLGTPASIRLGCNYGAAAGGMYFHRNNYFVDKPGTPINSPGNQVSYGGPRAACGVGALPANGMVYLLPNGLGCQCAAFHATVAYESGVAVEKVAPTSRPDPEQHEAIAEEKQTPATDADWPTYLANPARTAVTRQDLSKPRKLAWEVRVSGSPTPCIAVGDSVFLGSTDECVYALNGATGAVQWKYYAGAAFRSAPAYWNGRVLAGCDDGWLYCLSASDGKLLWRLRGAVAGRKQVAFESVISPWPVRHGLAADNGQVYFTAGLISGQGIDAFAVDAKTGQVTWRTPVGSTGIVPGGYIVLTPERVVLPSPGSASIYHPVCLARKDGTRAKSSVTHSDYFQMSYVEGNPADDEGYRQGFIAHGGSEGIQRGYRTGAGYCGRAGKNDSPYHLSPDAWDNGAVKVRDRGWFADGHSFVPVMTASGVYMRSKGALVMLPRGDLFKFLDIPASKPKDREALLKWIANDLPCGQPDWLVVAAGAKDGDATTLVAGGPKGVAAVNAADGKVLWSVTFEGSTLPGAIASGCVYVTSSDGKVRAVGE